MSQYVEHAAASELSERIESIRERIARACGRAGRAERDVTLVAVSKTRPIESVRAAFSAGIQDFGENRVQELVAKAEAEPGISRGGALRWHLIGSLQRNKAKRAVEVADVFHALDDLALAEEIDRRARAAGRRLPCFVQVNVSGEATKGGLRPEETEAFLDRVAGLEGLEPLGLMTLAAPADDPETVRPQFRALRELFDRFNAARSGAEVRLRYLSMGMSGDFEVAIEEGATHVRIGTALFGERT